VIETVLNACKLVVLDVSENRFANALLLLWVLRSLFLIVQSFLGHARGNELSVGSGLDGVVDYRLGGLSWVRENKLCHLNVVSEDINWVILSFHNCHEVSAWIHFLSLWVEAWVLESCERLKIFVKSLVSFQLIQPYTLLLRVEELTNLEHFSSILILGEFIQQKCFLWLLKQLDLHISILQTFLFNFHVSHNEWTGGLCPSIWLQRLSHKEHGVVLIALLRNSFHVIENTIKSLLILAIC
jgi:hypothetical protein